MLRIAKVPGVGIINVASEGGCEVGLLAVDDCLLRRSHVAAIVRGHGKVVVDVVDALNDPATRARVASP